MLLPLYLSTCQAIGETRAEGDAETLPLVPVVHIVPSRNEPGGNKI